MPTYITLWNYTQDGIETIDQSPDRLDDAVELVESMGGELTDFYLTMGQYDIVAITEFPDDETCAQAALKIAQTGTVSSETLRAFPEDESRDLVENLP